MPIQILYGTLDLMILRTLASMGPHHAYAIANRLQQISDDALNLNQGTIYPALVRVQQRGWTRGPWQRSFPFQQPSPFCHPERTRISYFRSSHRCHLCGSPQREPHAVVRSRNPRQEIRGSRGICGAPFGCPKFTVLQLSLCRFRGSFDGRNKVALVSSADGAYPSGYNMSYLIEREAFIQGGSYGDVENSIGPFVAKIDPKTLETKWYTQLRNTVDANE
jgi:hypothetical protein